MHQGSSSTALLPENGNNLVMQRFGFTTASCNPFIIIQSGMLFLLHFPHFWKEVFESSGHPSFACIEVQHRLSAP